MCDLWPQVKVRYRTMFETFTLRFKFKHGHEYILDKKITKAH